MRPHDVFVGWDAEVHVFSHLLFDGITLLTGAYYILDMLLLLVL